MIRPLLVAAVPIFVGSALMLSELRWWSRVPLTERLRPYAVGGMGRPRRNGSWSFESFREVIGPLSGALGERVARVFGVSEELSTRLERIHSPLDTTEFRTRQIGWSLAAFGIAAAVVVVLGAPLAAGTLAVLGAPLLTFLVLEQRLARASDDWKRRLFLELPVVCEQLGMLLSCGYSLGAALQRLSTRGQGAVASDLSRAVRRTRQGLSDMDALREWAAIADVTAVDRLVSVLALNREASDLGRLVASEARSVRRDVHRELIETIERRDQQVWIPVTVAALLPGVIVMAIPFVDALSMFSAS